jgi:alkylation response protein AidB-like acyl-CoA dehydrogenase
LDFSLNEYEDEFQSSLTNRLSKLLPQDWGDKSFIINDTDSEWKKIAKKVTNDLSKDRLLTQAWPEEFGGIGASHLKQAVFNHILSYINAPLNNITGVNWIGPALMMYGNKEQKELYLPRIAEAIDEWCLLYSEPTAGSDLASLQTRAVKNGDNYIINGQKIWASNAEDANFGLVAVRTNPDAPKHKGLSTLIVPMDSAGISINPIKDINGKESLNEVFFDNVQISSKNIVGEENRGWYQMASSLDYERSGIATFSTAKRNLEKLIDITKLIPEITENKKSYREDIANHWIEMNTGFNLAIKIPLLQDRGINPTYESSISKLYGTELTQKIAQTSIQLLGTHGQLKKNQGMFEVSEKYLAAIASTIAKGTSEIQRNTIARQGLGLPR